MSTFVPKNTLIWALQPPTSEWDYALSNFPCRTRRNQNLIPLPECVSVNIRDINSCGRQWPFINLAEYLKRVFGQKRERTRGREREGSLNLLLNLINRLSLTSALWKLQIGIMESEAVYHLIGAGPWAHAPQENIKASDDVFVANGNLQQYRIPSEVSESWNVTYLFASWTYFTTSKCCHTSTILVWESIISC